MYSWTVLLLAQFESPVTARPSHRTARSEPHITHTLQYTASKGDGTVREVHLWRGQGLKGKAVPATAEAITMHCVRPPDKIDQ